MSDGKIKRINLDSNIKLNEDIKNHIFDLIQADYERLERDCTEAVLNTDVFHLQQLIIIVYPDGSRYVACTLDEQPRYSELWMRQLFKGL
jgi:predicted component of type VI protein secretion system